MIFLKSLKKIKTIKINIVDLNLLVYVLMRGNVIFRKVANVKMDIMGNNVSLVS